MTLEPASMSWSTYRYKWWLRPGFIPGRPLIAAFGRDCYIGLYNPNGSAGADPIVVARFDRSLEPVLRALPAEDFVEADRPALGEVLTIRIDDQVFQSLEVATRLVVGERRL